MPPSPWSGFRLKLTAGLFGLYSRPQVLGPALDLNLQLDCSNCTHAPPPGPWSGFKLKPSWTVRTVLMPLGPRSGFRLKPTAGLFGLYSCPPVLGTALDLNLQLD